MENYEEIELIHSFIKDLSLEIVDPLEILNKKKDFEINISPLGIKSRNLENEIFEVVSDCKILVSNQENKKLFALEIEFSGIFKIKSEFKDIKELIYVNCASEIYPFLRSEIITISAKSGMYPINLPYIDFRSQYQRMKNNDQSNEIK